MKLTFSLWTLIKLNCPPLSEAQVCAKFLASLAHAVARWAPLSWILHRQNARVSYKIALDPVSASRGRGLSFASCIGAPDFFTPLVPPGTPPWAGGPRLISEATDEGSSSSPEMKVLHVNELSERNFSAHWLSLGLRGMVGRCEVGLIGYGCVEMPSF